MKQMAFGASKSFETHHRPTRKAEFLSRMDRLIPWALFCDTAQARALS